MTRLLNPPWVIIASKTPPIRSLDRGWLQPSERDEWYLNFGWRKKLVWGGTTSASFNPNPNYLFIPDQPPGSFSPRHVAEWEFSVVQPLLRGAGRTFNLAPLEISQLSADQSAWDFKDEVMTSVREIVAAYWDLYAAGVALDAIELIIPLVEEIVRIQREAHKAEWVTITEVAKAEAQMYEFRRERETRRSELLAAELRLRDLIGLPPEDGMKLIPITKPLEQHIAFSPQAVMLDALDNQPDLARRRIDIQVRSVEKEVALNGQKLQLDAIAVSRRNGVGESVDDAARQMLTADFYDWELGLKLTVPLGRRQAAAAVRASEQLLAKEKVLFDQQILTTRHDLQDNLRSIEFAYRQYSEATRQLAAAERWVEGAKLRYQNPSIGADASNVLVTNLNEYLNSLRFRTSAATDQADLIARYNSEMLRLEDTKGTILEFFGIAFNADPCRQSANFPRPTFSQLWPVGDASSSDTVEPTAADAGLREKARADVFGPPPRTGKGGILVQ